MNGYNTTSDVKAKVTFGSHIQSILSTRNELKGRRMIGDANTGIKHKLRTTETRQCVRHAVRVYLDL